MNKKANLEGSAAVTISDDPDVCPVCHSSVQPRTIGGVMAAGSVAEIAYQCPSLKCKSLFIAKYGGGHNPRVLSSLAPWSPKSVDFPEEIKLLSPSFIKIYEQAHSAEESGLDEIAGTGYRKALEFLIKDYCINLYEDKAAEIKKKFLGNVISDHVDSPQLKAVAKKSSWLGNDEVHYEKRYVGDDLASLKKFIKATMHWVEMGLLTAEEIKSQAILAPTKK